jgi:regulator of protease activity HflC (stomatin/prohibitin superfamily)
MRIAIAIILTVMTLIGINVLINTQGTNVYTWILLVLVESYVLLSFRTIRVNEVAMLTIFDEPIKDFERKGLVFIPLGIAKLVKMDGTIHQEELPGNPEQIFREEGKIPDGMFPPNRVKFGPPDPNDKDLADDLYNSQMVAEVPVIVAWRIVSVKTFQDQKIFTEKNCTQNLTDKVRAIFGTNLLSGVTPAKALRKARELNKQGKTELAEATASWGIVIEDTYMGTFIYSHDLNKAVEQATEEREKAKGLLTKTRAETDAKIMTAEGKATAALSEQKELLALGLATKEGVPEGEIRRLPDPTIKAQTDALKELGKITGTLVLGNATAMLGIPGSRKEEK